MNKKKCVFCNSSVTRKHGVRNGKQRYKCIACNKYFTGGNKPKPEDIWHEYVKGKQTYIQLATKYSCSQKSIQRKIDEYVVFIPKKHLEKL